MFFFFKQKTAYEVRISDWSSDVCSSDLSAPGFGDLSAPFQGEGTTPSGLVLRIWGSPIADDNYIATISDVTALRTSEAAYRDRAARLNSRSEERRVG